MLLAVLLLDTLRHQDGLWQGQVVLGAHFNGSSPYCSLYHLSQRSKIIGTGRNTRNTPRMV
jgi:hypothetical protein